MLCGGEARLCAVQRCKRADAAPELLTDMRGGETLAPASKVEKLVAIIIPFDERIGYKIIHAAVRHGADGKLRAADRVDIAIDCAGRNLEQLGQRLRADALFSSRIMRMSTSLSIFMQRPSFKSRRAAFLRPL